MRHCFSITTPGRRSIVPFRPSPFSVHSYQSLAHRKYHLPLRQLCCSGFSAAAFAAAAFCLRRLFCRCFLISCCLFSSRFFCCFLSAAAFSAAAFLSAAAFQQPLSSLSFCLGFFSSFGCRFLSCFSCFCRFSFSSSAPQQQPRLFLRFDCGFGGFCFCFFSSRLPPPLSSLLLPQLLASASAFAFSICRRFRCRLFRLLLL